MGLVGSLIGAAACSPERTAPALELDRFPRAFPRTYAGLEETVWIHKSERSLVVERADGTREPIGRAERENARRWVERFGRASEALVARMADWDGGESVSFAVAFDSLAGQEELAARLLSSDEAEAAAAREEHAARIAAMAAPLVEALAATGAEVRSVARFAPYIFAVGTPEQVDSAARIDGVAAALDGGDGAATEHLDPASPSTVHGVSALTNATGGNRKMGLIEPGKCRIRSTNVLIDAPVTYQTNANGFCLVSSECSLMCGEVPSSTCQASRCRDGHGTAVASVITQMMPDVSLFYGNGLAGGGSNTCSLQETAASFDFFYPTA